MRILYHHRTRCTDAQRVHILQIVGAFRDLGHEVEIASVVESEAGTRDEAAEPLWKRLVRRLPFAYEALQLGYNLAAVPWLWWRIGRFRPDFIYERYSLFNCAGVLAARLRGVPIVLEVNSPFAIEQREHREIRAARLALAMERAICNAATIAIVVSGPLRRIMAACGVRESRMVLMPNGVDPQRLGAGGGGELRAQLGIEGRTVIGFAGWFRPWHGLELLLDAFASAGLAGRGAVLALVGDGPSMPALRERARRLPPGAVIFAGGVPHEAIAPWLDLIDIAVQPAANGYCCPMKIVEYMGLGKAIVAPRQENIEELLEDGRTALLFPPGDGAALADALARLVEGFELRKRMGDSARHAVLARDMLWSSNAAAVVRYVAEHRSAASSGAWRRQPEGL